MENDQPSNVVDFNLAKQIRADMVELNQIHRFCVEVEGSLSFDSLDDLIESLEDQGFNVSCYAYPDEYQIPSVIIKGLSYEPLPRKTTNVIDYDTLLQEG
jgi:hypothetical protein